MKPSRPAQVTGHAKARGKSRCGLDARAFKRTAEIARREGLHAGDTAGQLRVYLEGKRQVKGNEPVIYGQHIYLFAGPHLITVLHLPHEFSRAAADCLRKRTR